MEWWRAGLYALATLLALFIVDRPERERGTFGPVAAVVMSLVFFALWLP